VYPFGTRPDIIDFTVVNPPATYCITPFFITDAVAGGISNTTLNELNALIASYGRFDVGTSTIDVENFLSNKISISADWPKLRSVFFDPAKAYCQVNYRGPNFYVGSREIFCKKWNDVFINFDWKDKPTDFRNYYKAYFAKLISPSPKKFIYGLDEQAFEINISLLQNGQWKEEKEHPLPLPIPNPADATIFNKLTGSYNRKLFPKFNINSFCNQANPTQQTFHLKSDTFKSFIPASALGSSDFTRLEASSLNGFVKFNLQNQDFLHKDYPYVLARQMLASGKLPYDHVDDAVYYDTNGDPIVVNSAEMLNQYTMAEDIAKKVDTDVNDNAPNDSVHRYAGDLTNLGTSIPQTSADKIRHILEDNNLNAGIRGLRKGAKDLEDLLKAGKTILEIIKKFGAIIPNEPWTPIIQNISIDYTATSNINDIDLIHLYPFKNTFKHEEIELEPTLFPTICDEGNLFVGLEKLVPGDNLNILFQLAEATADSESGREDVRWLYLDNNIWKPLRNGFEVINDGTEDLTTSGIIKFALPENMTNTNTVMPPGLHWIRASIPKNSKSVSETTGIHAQAIKAVFTNSDSNDKLRLSRPIEAGQIAKLSEADASVKKTTQLYETFGGQVPEEQRMFYVRVSELLRHKGRAIQKFDYERIVLDAFPQIFKAKCINHSFGLNAHLYKNDFPFAPGYVIMAVIPDLFKLKAGNAFEPKVPVSLLEKIDAVVRERTSTFVRFRSMNPRYERVHLSLRLKLLKGKDENYYKEKAAEDIREFLAPWAVGQYDKIVFGQCLRRSDIVRFLEARDYVDFILEMNMRHELQDAYPLDTNGLPLQQMEVCPKTPRSILIAGNVEICIEKDACATWDATRGTACENPRIKLIDYCEDVKQ
jgi:hypothetical protein